MLNDDFITLEITLTRESARTLKALMKER